MSGLLSFMGGMGKGWVDDADKRHEIDLKELDHELDVELKRLEQGMHLNRMEVAQGYDVENAATQHGYGMARIGAQQGGQNARQNARFAETNRRTAEANERADKLANEKRFLDLVEKQDLEDWQNKNPDIRLGPKGKVIKEGATEGVWKPVMKVGEYGQKTSEIDYFYNNKTMEKRFPTSAPPGGKPVTMKEVNAFAMTKGITPAEVIEELRKKGVEVVK